MMSVTAEPTVMSGKTRVLDGITVIDPPLITRAMDYARTIPNRFSSTMLYDLGYSRFGWDSFRAVLHDLGLTNSFTGPKRFEIEGADAARAFGREQGLDDRRVQLIWDSVAERFVPGYQRPSSVDFLMNVPRAQQTR
jgi:hypothetical protein